MTPELARALYDDLLPGWSTARLVSGNHRVRCPIPGHDDKNPSFDVDPEKLVWICRSSCGSGGGAWLLAERLLGKDRALALVRDLEGGVAPRHPAPLATAAPKRVKESGVPKVVARYDYRDENGELLYQVERLEPKGFRQRKPDGRGSWSYKLGDTRRVPYKLPELMAERALGGPAGPFYIAEGEKDVEALHGAGCIATCNAGGAGQWRAEFAEYLQNSDVVIVQDKDEPGRKHARDVAASLRGVARGVRIVEAKAGKDTADHLAAGFGVDDFLEVTGADTMNAAGPHIEPEGSGAGRRAIEPGPVLLNLEQVTPRPVEWLWPGRIPRGKLTILDGDPDVGKSTITLDLAARVSTGAALPDGMAGTLGGVVLLSAEDDPADTIVPRLLAAGADLRRVRLLEGIRSPNADTRPAELPLDLSELEAAIATTGAVLVVVDPLMAFLDGETNAHRDQDVRRALAPLARLAERTRVAFLVVRHLNKSGGGHALYRGGGSIGIIGAARSGLLAARDPDNGDQRVLAVTKSNLAERAPSLSYALRGAGDTARIEWLGQSGHSSSSLLEQPLGDEERSAVETAVEFLEAELRQGPVSPNELYKKARSAGISEITLRRAKDRACERPRKTGMRGGWVWELKQNPKMINGAEDAQPHGVITFGLDDHLRDADSGVAGPAETEEHLL